VLRFVSLSERMRHIAKPEPEVRAHDEMDDAVLLEGVPDDRRGDVEMLANVLRVFAESVRGAK
jgi:hypothetical protein